MTILVTGGAGYIGSHMVLALMDAGREVVVVDDLSTGRRNAVPSGIPLVVADCGDEQRMIRLMREHRVASVMHFAGSIIVPDSVADPLRYYKNNTVNSRSLIAAAVTAGVGNFVFSSTAAVYGNPQQVPIAEDAPLQPVSPYGNSKLLTEVILRDTAAAGQIRYAALRYFNVAGADPKGRAGQSSLRATHLIKVACEAAVGRRAVVDVYGADYPTPDGTGVRDYIHVSDLAEAHLLALEHLEHGGGSVTLNCGYGHGSSVLEVIERVREISGVGFPVYTAPRRPGDPATLIAATELIRRELGWKPRYDDLTEMVRHALAWERSLAGSETSAARSAA
jgi:UDP-glucose 4-epimerase